MRDYPWFRVFPGELLGKTRRLTASQSGIFFVLLMTMMEGGEPLSFDTKQLARLCNASRGDALSAAMQAIEAAGLIYFTEDGRIWSALADEEVKNRTDIARKAADSVNTRWAKKRKENNGRSVRPYDKIKESDSHSDFSPLPPKGDGEVDKDFFSSRTSSSRRNAPPGRRKNAVEAYLSR